MTKRILFCTIGATPQVVTETVWALQKRTPPWLPDEIHIVTTTFKLSVIRSSLMALDGPLAALFAKLPRVVVHVPCRSGAPLVFDSLGDQHNEVDNSPAVQRLQDPGTLSDVNSQDDAAIMGNLILQLMACFTSSPDTEVHVSLAGGRKTMSAHALLALSLVGRARDEASHVLVSPVEFEDHPEFWYPGQGGLVHAKEDLRKSPMPAARLDPKDAEIALVPTPAPLMRHEVRDVEALERLDLGEMVKLINLAAVLRANPDVHIDTNRNAIAAGGIERVLGPKLFAIYRLMATARKENWPGVGPDGFGSDCKGWLSVPFICIGTAPSRKRIDRVLLEYLRDAVQAAGGDTSDHESIREWEDGVVDETSPSKKLMHAQTALGARTRLLDTLRKEFGGPAAAVIGSKDTRTRQPKLLPGQPIRIEGSARFGLDLPPDNIKID